MDFETAVVVDTDVVSFVFKNHSLSRAYLDILAGRSLAVSLITRAEIEYWMEVKNWGEQRRSLMSRFLSRFTPLLPDINTAKEWARIRNECEKKGRALSFSDAWIAAAALQFNIPLVTHNAKDYAPVQGLKLLTVSDVGL